MLKHKKNEEPENHERWLVSYADFITLLFAFFTVMYATSQADNEKRVKFEQSFKKAFGLMQVGDPSGVVSDPFPTHVKDGSVIDSPIKIFENKNSSKSEIRDAIWQLVYDNLTTEQIKDAGLKIEDDSEGVRISLASNSLFPAGSAKVLPEALKSLDAIGEILKKTQRRLIIEGHTDDGVVQSEVFPSNWELAAGRASTIVRYLIKRHQIAPDLMSAVSYADQRPIVPNTNDNNRSQNRRIEVLISIL